MRALTNIPDATLQLLDIKKQLVKYKRADGVDLSFMPFSFQSERRTLWEAPEMYIKVSPFMVANKINEPILLIHGEADNNTGTFPIQSERMYQALRGHGATVRYVTLPLEAHGYAARDDRARPLRDDQLVRQAGEERPAAQARVGHREVSRRP